MPGIFGIITKKEQTGKEIPQFMRLMREKLMHQDWYFSQDYLNNRLGLGSIAIQKRYQLSPNNHGQHEYIVLIDGYIYKINNRRTSSLVDPFKSSAQMIVEILQKNNYSDLAQIEGNYVVAVYDKTEQNFFLFNDIIGPRRIYYADFADYFVFSQEVKAISCLPFFKKEIDLKGIADFLNYGYVLGENTLLKSIHSFRSGSLLKYSLKDKTLDIKKYWSPGYSESTMTMEDASEEIYRLLGESLDEKLQKGNSIISPISGGLDSRIILGRLTSIDKNISIIPITYGQKFSYEYKNAKKVCHKLGFNNHRLIDIQPELLIDKYEESVWFTDGMSTIHTSHLLIFPKALGLNYDYVFNGIYGGPTNYSAEYYRYEHIDGKYNHDQKTEDIRKSISLSLNHYENILAPDILKKVSSAQSTSIAQELNFYLNVSDRFCNQRDAFFIENRMRRAICQGALYRFFWEEQLPLSHYPLYHFFLKTPPQLKLHRSLLKTTLIRKFPELASIPDANTGLNLYQQPGWWYHKKEKMSRNFRYYVNRLSVGKIGFYDRRTYAHHLRWFQHHTPTYQFYEKWLHSDLAKECGFIQPNKIDTFLISVKKTGLGFDHLVRIVTVLIWYKLFYLEDVGKIPQQIKMKK